MIADTAVFPSGAWSDPSLARFFGDNESLLADVDVEFLEAEINRVKQERDGTSQLRQMNLNLNSTSCGNSLAGSEISDDMYIDIENNLDSTLLGLNEDHEYLTNSLLSALDDTTSFSDQVEFGGFNWTDSDLDLPIGDSIDVSSSNEASSDKVPSPSSSPRPERKRTSMQAFSENTPWSSMSYNEQLTTVEKLTSIVSSEMDLRDQLEVIKIINKDVSLSPTDTEFVIDLACLNDQKVEEVRDYIRKHKTTCTTTTPTTTTTQQKKMCKKQERRNYQKALKQRQRKEYRQMLKEKKSGLFKKEEVLALSSNLAEPDTHLSDVDILA